MNLLHTSGEILILRLDAVSEQPVQDLKRSFQIERGLLARESSIICAAGKIDLHTLPHQHFSQQLQGQKDNF